MIPMEQGLSIKDLENLSGVKAHTIRIWEKRYNLFDPQRTDTNIRYYSNEDLRKLLNITSVSEQGMKISKISSLTDSELNQEVERLLQENVDSSKKILINKLIVATLQCDVSVFDSVYQDYTQSNGTECTIEEVIYPLLIRIGLMWSVSKLNPAQEHFASQLIRQKLFSAIDALPIASDSKKYILFLPEKETHEIALLYAYYLIRSAGNECIYLGADVPLIDVESCFQFAKADTLMCSFTIPRKKEILAAYLQKMVDKFGNSEVLVQGVPAPFVEDYPVNGIKFLNNIADLKNIL